LDSLQTNTTIVSKTLCVDGQKLWRWYRDHLSGFWEEGTQAEHYKNDIEIIQGKGKETIRVPILKPENIGPNMAIDEKQIGEDMHTILSNRDTGKIAMLARTVSAGILQKAIASVGDKVDIVSTMTRDMSSTYAKFGDGAFPNASQIADKFHIVKDLLESCQAVRIRYRQEALRDKRIAYDEHKKQEKQKQKECIGQEKLYEKKNFSHKEEILDNGDTIMEALARSRYLLFKYRSEWTESQIKRANALFMKFPEIEKVYDLACEFRNWIKKSNVGKEMHIVKKNLRHWFQKVEEAEIDEMLNFKSTIERNSLVVLNYFRFGATNAIAENINSRIQRFVMINQGTRDREFFYFRLANYFS
jgi:transposase